MRKRKRIIPLDELVISIAENILKNRLRIVGKKNFLSLVKKELKKIDSRYTVPEKRFLKIIVSSNKIRIRLETKKGELKEKICPICGNKLEPMYFINVLGKKDIYGYKCGVCGIKIRKGYEMPRALIFEYRS